VGRPACVLLVDDDPSMQRILVDYLAQHNMRVLPAAHRHEMARQLARAEPSVVILDLRLGQDDGLDLLRELRTRSDVPVIITTGFRLDEIDRVVGLELGADDYVTKPYSPRELLARIRAVLRRQELGPRRLAPRRRARPLPLRGMATGSQRTAAHRSEQLARRPDQGRIHLAHRLSRCAATPAQSRKPVAGDPHP
jgi:DNA-binding response OmpR family regulator